MKRFLLGLSVVLAATSLYAKDIQEVCFTPNPPMSCQNCENKIKKNIRFEKGVKQIETNLNEQKITVTYDADQTNPQKIENGFEKIGYQVTIVEPTQKEE